MDVTSEFLNSILNDVIYITPPPCFEHLLPVGKTIRLLKALHGLKQARRVLNATKDTILCKIAGIKPSNYD